MRFKTSSTIILIACLFMQILFSTSFISRKELNDDIVCSACRKLVDLVQVGIDETVETHDYQVGFRLDEKKNIPYARSEFRIMEILDSLCSKMKNWGISGSSKPKFVVDTSNISGSFGALEVSEKASRQVNKVCEYVVDRFYEEITAIFHKDKKNKKKKLCIERAKLCTVEEIDLLKKMKIEADKEAKQAAEDAKESEKDLQKESEEEKKDVEETEKPNVEKVETLESEKVDL